jgi:hypothetical protein
MSGADRGDAYPNPALNARPALPRIHQIRAAAPGSELLPRTACPCDRRFVWWEPDTGVAVAPVAVRILRGRQVLLVVAIPSRR